MNLTTNLKPIRFNKPKRHKLIQYERKNSYSGRPVCRGRLFAYAAGAGWLCCYRHSTFRFAGQEFIEAQKPDFVLLDIFLKGKQTGIDLAKELTGENIPFVYLSANSNEEVLNAAKATQPYGFLVKPFREKDLLVTLEIARYRHQHSLESKYRQEEGVEKRHKKNYC